MDSLKEKHFLQENVCFLKLAGLIFRELTSVLVVHLLVNDFILSNDHQNGCLFGELDKSVPGKAIKKDTQL